jgi:alpha/beta superfamily hydrolase
MPEVIINGPEGRLEGRYHISKQPNAPIALLLHPHPQHGGTMNNKVVYTLYHAFVKRGFAALRFNFRGVGRSQGVWDRGEGELSDAAAALDWLQDMNQNAGACWIAGFSFGAYIGMQLLMRRPEIDGFIAVAPPANHYDLSFLAPCPASGVIIYGTRDSVTTAQDMERVISRIRTQKNIKVDGQAVEGADHFFRGRDPGEDHLADVEKHARAYLERRLAAPPRPPTAKR